MTLQINTEKGARLTPVTHGPAHHFFGYYDKSPWDASGRWLLGMKAAFMDRPPGPEDELEIGMIDTASGNEWVPLATSRAWNWQQGCMLQWLGGGPEIAFNDRRGDHFITRIIHTHTGEEHDLERPVYAIHPAGHVALSINFSRLHHQRPGYGYPCVPDRWREIPEPEEDGIFVMDLTTGKSRLILSLAQAAQHERNAAFEGKMHRFNHLQFSRDGARFAFLHRYQAEGPHETRLMTLGLDGEELQTLSDHGMVSHYDWHSDGSIIAWARRRGMPDGYFIFPREGGRPERLEVKEFTGDGHCSFSPCGRYLLTDTYPDAERRQRLMIYDIAAREVVYAHSLGSASLPDEIRCDLHPRWSRDGRQISIDSTFEGTRQIYTLEHGVWA